MITLEELFASPRTMYILDMRDIYFNEHVVWFERLSMLQIPVTEIVHTALTVINCRLRAVEPSMEVIIDSVRLHSVTGGVWNNSIDKQTVSVCIGIIVSIIEPHFQHLYGTHYDPSIVLCLRSVKDHLLLLNTYRVNTLAFAL